VLLGRDQNLDFSLDIVVWVTEDGWPLLVTVVHRSVFSVFLLGVFLVLLDLSKLALLG
jgi:hypothetical protein